jgi:HK97 family phage major capsid protein
METQVQESRTAAAEIIRLGKLHGIDNERVAKMVGDGLTVDQASREILAEVEKRGAKPVPQPSAENQDRLELTDQEQQEYNLARGIMAAVANRESDGQRRVNSFEMEVSDQIQKGWRGATHGGLFVPWTIRHAWNADLEKRFAGHLKRREERMTRAGLSSNVSTAGQELKFTEPGEFIQYLYNRMRVKQLGARTLAGLRDNVSYPKQTGRATGSWVGENPGTDVADSALTLGSILSSPKTYQSSSSYSRQLLAQAVIDVDSLVREDLARDLALAVDSAAISGTGTLQPLGILNTTGVQSYVMESDSGNGGLPVWQDVVLMEALLEEVNADQLGTPGWLATPSTKAVLKTTARLGNTIGLPIWADNNTVDGLEALSTNQMPSAGTKGTGTHLSTLILGTWSTIIIGMWGSGFELVVDPYRLKKQGMIELTTFMMTDVTMKYPVGFVVAAAVAAA